MLRQIVQQHFPPRHRPAGMVDTGLTVALGPHAAEIGARATAYAGIGLDLTSGECLLAGVASFESHRGYDQRTATIVTNRRTIFSGWMTAKGELNDVAVGVHHDEVHRVEAKRGALAVKLEVHGPRGVSDLSRLSVEYKGATDFFHALSQIPLGQRAEPPIPLPVAGADDPAGAQAANAGLWYPDARAGVMLHSLDQAAREGRMDGATALDLVHRVQLAHRTMVSGCAGYGHALMSAMSADDLAFCLANFLGPPIGRQMLQGNVAAYDFRYSDNDPQMSRALAAVGVAAYVGLGVGFSPGRMIAAQLMKKDDVRAIRLCVADVPGGCSYELYANNKRLERGEGQLALGIHQGLAHSAYDVLERRCRLGWNVPFAQLFG